MQCRADEARLEPLQGVVGRRALLVTRGRVVEAAFPVLDLVPEPRLVLVLVRVYRFFLLSYQHVFGC